MNGNATPSSANNALTERLDISFALQAARLGVWELELKTNIVNWDDRCRELYGLAKDNQLTYEQTIQYIHSDDVELVAEALQRAMNPHSDGYYDATYRTIGADDGVLRWVRFTGRSYFNEQGEVYRFAGIAMDVTRDVQQQTKENEERRRLNQLFAQAPVAINIMRGRELVFELANPLMCELLDRRVDELIGKPLLVALPEVAGQGFIELLTGVLDTGVPYAGFEMPISLRRQGKLSTAYFNFVYQPLHEADGSISILTVASEVTEAVLSRQKVQESELELAFAIDAAELGVWDLNPQTSAFKGNARLKDWFGLQPTNEIPLPLALDIIIEQDRARVTDTIWRAMQYESGGQYDIEYTIVHPITKKERVVRAKGKAQFGADRVAVRFNGTLQDITERKQAEKALQASEARMRSLIKAAPVAIGLFVGRDLVIDMPNKTFIDIVGKGHDIVGKPLREVMPELITENQPFLQILDDVYTTGQPFQSYGSLVKIVQQGVMTSRYYNITYSPLYNETGEVYAILDVAVDVTGQIETQQELEQQKTYLQNALSIAELGTFQVDVATNVGTFSDNIRQWFGLASVTEPMERVLGRIHPDDVASVEDIISKAVESEANSHHDFVYRVIEPDAAEVRYLRSFGKAQYKNGVAETIVGVLQDVTPQIQSQQKIEASEQNLRSIVESAPFPIGVYVGRDMRIQLVNQAIVDVWGKGNDVVGKRYADILPELENQHIYEQLDRVYTTGIPFHAKNQRVDIRVDGVLQPYYFNYSFTPLRDANGHIYGVMNTAAEVTDLVTAKQQVEETEADLRAAVELAELVTWKLDIKRGKITYSPRFMDWLGFSENTKSLDEMFNPLPDEYRESVSRALEATWQPGSSGFYDNEHPIVNRLTGQVRIIHAQARLIHDANGKPAFMNGTAQDVTEQRRVQQELERQVAERTQQLQMLIQDLERSNRNLQQFAYVASHDLQEPLRKIQSFGDLLKGQYATQLGDGVDFLSRMQTAASRMSTLIKDLLAYSRISTQQEATTPVSLAEVVNATLSDLELTIQETGAVVEVDALPTISGDRSQLGQLFQNLISNALKFRRTEASGQRITPHIQIRAERVAASQLPEGIRPTRVVAAYYRIDVADNGIGFDTKYLDRIFQVFQRLHGKSEFAGTGIGLAICEKVVANHGGAITARSQPGEGATFHIYLPE